MAHGGKRNGAGRRSGVPSLNRRALIEAAEAGGEMPIAYMLRVMRDENAPDQRRDAMAKVAAAYLHSKLSLIQDEYEEAEAAPPGPEARP